MTANGITITRRLPAPVEDVYAAWTEPRLMAGWLGDPVEADVRVGGSYRIENDGGGGVVYVHTGEYQVLEPGRRVRQSFQAGPVGTEPAQPGPYRDEYIEARLRPLDAGETELTFTNGWNGPPLSEDDEIATRQAWEGWLDLLERALGS